MYVTIPTDHSINIPDSAYLEREQKTAELCLRAGSRLYYEDDPVEHLYQVKSGVLCLTRLLEDGRRQVIAFGYPGDFVGFPSGGLHHADCEALTDTRLQSYRLSLLESGDGDPDLHKVLLNAALREISAMQDHFMMLGRKSAVEKVASFLCALTERGGTRLGQYQQVLLPMNRTDIADFLGLTTETVSRTFSQLRKSNVIAIDNIRTVIVLQPEKLLELSKGQTE